MLTIFLASNPSTNAQDSTLSEVEWVEPSRANDDQREERVEGGASRDTKIDKKFYIGYTTDLKRRLQEHSEGNCYTTLRMHKPQFVFSEDFACEADARRREGYFKTTKGKKTLRLMLRDTLQN